MEMAEKLAKLHGYIDAITLKIDADKAKWETATPDDKPVILNFINALNDEKRILIAGLLAIMAPAPAPGGDSSSTATGATPPPVLDAVVPILVELKNISLQQARHMGKQTFHMGKQTRMMAFMMKEAAIQRRSRLNVWSSGRRTHVEQQDFKSALIEKYGRASAKGEDFLRCMILDVDIPRQNVIASHIWKFCTEGEGLDEFGLKSNDLSNFRNGFLLCESIEKAFDSKRVCFLVDRLRPEEIFIKVLDPNLFKTVVNSDSPTTPKETFFSIDGRKLQHPPGVFPFRRILDFHAKMSFRKAISKGWVDESSTVTDFFNLSFEGSIPDNCAYDYETDRFSAFDDQESIDEEGN